MQMCKLMRAEKRKGITGHGWDFNGNEQVTIPRKGRIRSPMPVREARKPGFKLARRIQQSRIDAMIRRRLHWEMIDRNALRELTEQAQELGLY